MICHINNDIPNKIPSHPYVLVNRSILSNCRIDTDNHHLLESIATCDNKITKLVMYFTINLAFTNYLDMLPNQTDSLLIIKNRMRHEQPLPLNLSIPHFGNSLRHRFTKLKDFMNDYINNDKEIFDLQQRHAIESLTSSNKNFFSSYIVNIFMFTSSIISIITITLVIYLFCKQKHIRTIVANVILHKIKEVEANSNPNPETNKYECGTLAYAGIMLTVLSMIIVIFLHYRKSRLCRGYRFFYLRCTKLYRHIEIWRYKPEQKLLMGHIRINCNKITKSFNDNKIDLPKIVTNKM